MVKAASADLVSGLKFLVKLGMAHGPTLVSQNAFIHQF